MAGLGLVLSFASTAAADIDLTGRWLTLDGEYALLVQTGDQVTVEWTQFVPGAGSFPSSASGTFDQTTLLTDGPVLRMTQLGDGAVLVGTLAFQFSTMHVQFTRCECYDGNQNDGDGCDSTCAIEPCFSCTPEPSTCLPSADAAACDDHDDCTTAEFCSAGACGGGTEVSPCVNMTGQWRLHVETVHPLDGTTTTSAREHTFLQRNGVLREGSRIGWIDPATGEFSTVAKGGSYTCSISSDMAGAADTDNLTLQAIGHSYFPQLRYCLGVRDSIVGYRCDEEAGCDLSDCSGVPDGRSCRDDDPCTGREVCTAGVCSGGPFCPLCTVCDGTGACIPGPRPDCRLSLKPSTGRLSVVDSAEGEADDLRWMWKSGVATSLADFGDPQATDDISLCVFSDEGLLYEEELPADAACPAPPCWTTKNGKLTYKAKPSGDLGSAFSRMILRSGEEGKAGIQLRASGYLLESGGFLAIPVATPLRTQLQIGNGSCFELGFDAEGVLLNADGRFKAKGGTLP